MRDRAKDIKNARTRAVRARYILDKVKTKVGCAMCGFNSHPAALDFNHFKGKKRLDITKMVTYSWDSIKTELAKCVVLCANCHRVYTHPNKERYLEDAVLTRVHSMYEKE